MKSSARPQVRSELQLFHANPEVSTSYGTGHQPVRLARACCKAPQPAPLAIRAPEFAVLSKNPASRAAREGIRPSHARGRPLSRPDPAIPEHRQFEYRACDWFLSL